MNGMSRMNGTSEKWASLVLLLFAGVLLAGCGDKKSSQPSEESGDTPPQTSQAQPARIPAAAQVLVCLTNQRMLNTTAQLYHVKLDHKPTSQQEMVDKKYLNAALVCPAGGTYTLVEDVWRCSDPKRRRQ